MPERVRTVCTVEGYEDFWLEWDVSEWNIGVYVEVTKHMMPMEVITDFIPRYSVDWKIANQDGTFIAHPGPNASKDVWLNVWKQLDVTTSRALFLWLWVSVLNTLEESMALPPKSEADDSAESTGPSNDGDGGEGDSAS